MKADSQTPFSALWGAAALEEAGLPEGLVQVITGSGSELGPELIDRVDYVMFTGSTEVGRKVASQAAERLIPSSMELGGTQPDCWRYMVEVQDPGRPADPTGYR